ncbi:MAG: hypothetical protein WC713_12245 [Candidatus Methylomirabilota bacterium]
MKRPLAALGIWVALSLVSAGCAPLVPISQRVLDSGKETLRLRSMQTRLFETADREGALRDVVATLRDLDFTITKADAVLGVVSGAKPGMRITVTVAPRGERRLIVRANAEQGMAPVEEPEAYQRFFAALEKAMFLTAHQAD